MTAADIIKTRSRRFAWLTAVMGVATCAIFLWLALVGPSAGCNGLPATPLIALQNARSFSDIALIIGNSSSPCAILREQISFLTLADLFIFIPFYAIFLSLFIVMYGRRNPIMTSALWTLLIVMITGDLAETLSQFQLVNYYSAQGRTLFFLAAGNNAKVLALAAFLIGLAVSIGVKRTWLDTACALFIALCGVMRILGFTLSGLSNIVPLSSFIAYIVLTISSLANAMRSARSGIDGDTTH